MIKMYQLFRKHRSLLLLAIMIMAVSLVGVGCAKKTEEKAPTGEAPKAKGIKVGIVLSTGGKGDKSFNDAAIAGLERAKQELGIEYKYIEPKEMASDEEALRFLAENGYDLVIGVGFLMKTSLEKVATEFPDVKFALIDEVVDKPNVASLTFKEHEGSFLAGVLAAMMSKTGNVGFVGGADFPLIHKFEEGYRQGVEYVNKNFGKNVKVQSAYAGTTGEAFNDPVKGKALATTQFNNGADIIYHASGGTGQGVFEAAAEKGKFAIGVDSNQNWIKPGTILASMLKRVDVAVFQVVKDTLDGKFTAGNKVFGVKEDGVGLTDLRNVEPVEKEGVKNDAAAIKKIEDMKKAIPDDVVKAVNDAKEKIAKGEITVKDPTAK
ncbi:basic membrane protein A [Carboxydocella sporoproducens DSM 16521]|uniref:Basic membrane protein A n=3 Tax=Clostridiales Family XVI. Incertae Sedis TaxID=543347 RepID=A0A1T4S7B5_9FIRM|nr:nucleoside-binding protein [Carboxydocella thermautotrophica]AVX31112.1 nucleoside-binding protein [Carboxydocella thermautotrophica]GAW28223.1 BMP family ABC transporter substrate-binding protein [Carboxydocella sp. ULO1]GAW32830.1 BMP family ABC transporter substrate-binding protein [Carboxydocella sp. JDF658]SKA24133.1 basic membrane protein A [Carboxydocella sporoproducens DSM 16521]